MSLYQTTHPRSQCPSKSPLSEHQVEKHIILAVNRQITVEWEIHKGKCCCRKSAYKQGTPVKDRLVYRKPSGRGAFGETALNEPTGDDSSAEYLRGYAE
jgi:hypothetical protein